MTLAVSNLAHTQGTSSGVSPQSCNTGSITVVPGAWILVAAMYCDDFGDTPTFTLSATGGSWTFTQLGSTLVQASFYDAIAFFVAQVPVGVTSTTITVSATSAASAFTVMCNVDQAAGVVIPGTPNFVFAAENFTTAPGASLPNFPASTSGLYSFVDAGGGQPGGPNAPTAQPSGFSVLRALYSATTSGDGIFGPSGGFESAYIGSSPSQGPNDWTLAGSALKNTLLYLELPTVAPPPPIVIPPMGGWRGVGLFGGGVSPSFPKLATLSYPPNADDTYTPSTADPALVIAGQTSVSFLNINVWGPVAGETLVAKVHSARQWELTSNIPGTNQEVTCYPSIGYYGGETPAFTSFSYFIGGWDDYMDTGPNLIGECTFDTFVNNTLTNPQGGLINEVMMQFDFRNRFTGGTFMAHNVPFGGYMVNGVYIPLTYWNIAYDSTAVFFLLSDGASNTISLPRGAIDYLAMIKYLITNGWLAAGTTLQGFSIGFEICGTNGVDCRMGLNNGFWSAG